MNSALNPLSSMTLACLSGVGLLAVVTFAPTRVGDSGDQESSPYNSLDQEESRSELETFERGSESKNRVSPFRRILEDGHRGENQPQKPLLNLRIDPDDLRRYMEKGLKLQESMGTLGFQRSQVLDIQNFRRDRGFTSGRGDLIRRDILWKESYMQVDGSIAGVSSGSSMFRDQGWGKYNRSQFRSLGLNSPSLDYLDINIPLSRSVSAVFSASSNDIYDDRNRESQFRSYALAGVSFKQGEILSTRLLAGDRNLTIHRQNFNPAMPGATAVQDFRRMGLDERESTGLRSFEWQTNLQPTKSVRLQTAVFNQPNPEIRQSNSSSLPDSGRMSVFLGEKSVILNVKYTYQMSEQNMRNIATQWQPKQDAASMGFIVFLDPSQNYSLYVGGNQFNITERMQGAQRSNGSSSNTMPSSFTASFRGKTGGKANSNFFVNFQNQPPGAWGLGMPGSVLGNQDASNSRSFYEYATTLGLEVNF